jgi:DNA-binding transcriptional regulator/RsmH inhibitor MraZ
MQLVILPGRCQTLLAVSADKAQKMLEKLTSGSFANENITKAMAMIGSFSSSCSCDNQGRISLTKKQMDYAGISEDVIFVGAFDSIQIWSKENREAQAMDLDGILDVVQSIQEQPSDVGVALESLMNNGTN